MIKFDKYRPLMLCTLSSILFYIAAPTITEFVPATTYVSERFEVSTVDQYLDKTRPRSEEFVNIHTEALYYLLIRVGTPWLFDQLAEIHLIKVDTENWNVSVEAGNDDF